MTRLLYVHNIAMPGPEANTVNVAKMCDAFAAHGCAVTLAVLPGTRIGELERKIAQHYGLQNDINVVALPAMCRRPTLAALAGGFLAAARRPDIVYTRAPHVAWLACSQGIATILEVHADLSAFSALGAKLLREAIASRRLLGTVVISNALAQRLRASLGASTSMVVAHGGADCGEAPTPVWNPHFNVGFVGRFYRGRGLELIRQLAIACPWAEFHVAGGDARTLAGFTGPLPHNILVHGSLPHVEAGRLMQRCDVLLAPYQRAVYVADGRTDTAGWMSPLKVFEYMAAGRAIVASDLPALREVLADGETALLRDPEDAAAWIAALEHLRIDTRLRMALGMRAFQSLKSHYTWRARAGRILAECSRMRTAVGG